MIHSHEAFEISGSEIRDEDGRKSYRPTMHYFLALLLIALAAIASHIILVHSLRELDEDAIAVNTSGRQRMLSEQTYRLAADLMTSDNADDRQILKDQLRGSLALMRESHEHLANAVKRTANPSSTDLELKSAFFEGQPSLDERLNSYFAALDTIIASDVDTRDSASAAYGFVALQHRNNLLRDLDGIVKFYELRAKLRVQASKNLHIYVMFALLLLVLIETIFIFMPLVRRQSQIYDELRQARDKAQSQLASRSTLLAAVSHEIRTPLGGLIGIIDELKRERSQAERERGLSLIEDSCAVLLDTLDAILQQKRIDSNPNHLAHVRFRPSSVAQRVAELFRPLARRKGIRIEVNATVDTEAIGDPARLQQVLANLVSNGVKFTHSGAVTIYVQPPITESDEWVFVVADTGTGMDDKRLLTLFLPFGESAEDSLGRSFGAGLGLSIVSDVSTALGGSIEVESELGRGTTFTFKVPFKPILESPDDATASVSSGTLLMLVDGASDQVQAEAITAQSGLKAHSFAAGEDIDDIVIVLADAARIHEVSDEIWSACKRGIILESDNRARAAIEGLSAGIQTKVVTLSRDRLVRALPEIIRDSLNAADG